MTFEKTKWPPVQAVDFYIWKLPADYASGLMEISLTLFSAPAESIKKYQLDRVIILQSETLVTIQSHYILTVGNFVIKFALSAP